jgi:hypothetical protein
MTPISLTCPALTGGAFPAIPTMSHTLTVTPREPHLSGKQHWALEILAAAGLRGCTGATLLALGFSVDMLADVVHEGLATAHRQTMRVGRRKVQFAGMMITDAGQRALDG